MLQRASGGKALHLRDDVVGEALRFPAEGTGDVRGEEDVGQLEERRVRGQDIGVGGVQDCEQPALAELIQQCVLIDDAASPVLRS